MFIPIRLVKVVVLCVTCDFLFFIRIPPSLLKPSHIPVATISKSRSRRSSFILHPAIKINFIPHPAFIFTLIPHPAKPMLDPQDYAVLCSLWALLYFSRLNTFSLFNGTPNPQLACNLKLQKNFFGKFWSVIAFVNSH